MTKVIYSDRRRCVRIFVEVTHMEDKLFDTTTMYNLVVTDEASGERDVVTDRSPLIGHLHAEEEVRHMERLKPNPKLHYSAEPSRPKPKR